jgi:DNA-nicking Smr family endonuclease
VKKINHDAVVPVPITETLDLHGFQPKEVKDLVIEYLYQCEQKGISDGRIIHGKGIGTLRDIVHSILKKHKQIKCFRLSEPLAGGWGATSFTLNLKKK